MATKAGSQSSEPMAEGVLAELVEVSRLLGSDPSLVLHGGGNTSAKGRLRTLLGEDCEALFVKGSGSDMATIEAPGFPAVDLAYLRRLRALDRLGDKEMVNELRTHLFDAGAPTPSVEALLHAFLPHRFILHTHADAVLTLTNQPGSQVRLQRLYGQQVALVPYIMPGFLLAKACAQIYEDNPQVEALLLIKHGLFTFGDTAKEAYEKMVSLVNLAEHEIESSRRTDRYRPPPADVLSRDQVAALLCCIRRAYADRGMRAVLHFDAEPESLAFVASERLLAASQGGPLTPDHVIRTKRLPLVLHARDLSDEEGFGADLAKALDEYEEDYRRYFEENRPRHPEPLTMLDPLPRIMLVPALGVVSVGTSAREAAVVGEICSHTMAAICAAEEMDGYQALPASDTFDVEYWSLEQAKLKKKGATLPLHGKTALVTGAASGIGRAVAAELYRLGACVSLVDRDEEGLRRVMDTLLAEPANGNSLRGFPADVAAAEAVGQCFRESVRWTGGIDIVVQNAGIFPSSQPIVEIDEGDWHRSLSVNLDGALHVAREALRWMGRNAHGGDLVVIASKNVPAPGKGAASYSVAKAAQTQLARICALEGASMGIRVNVLHPHLIFDTGLWSQDLLARRAAAYGMSPEEYRRSNLLRTDLCSADVAHAVRALVDGSFTKTTGAQIPIDGGSERTL